MPTPTFLKLPAPKKEKIIRAITDELSRVPFDKVSINKIIRSAEIPRGSFYQYFTDKNDVLEFILLDYQKLLMGHMKECLRANNGDIFRMFYETLGFTIDFATGDSGNNFCKNLFADIKVNTDFYLKMSKNARESEAINELRPFINVEMLDLREKDDFNNMLDVLFSVYKDGIAEIFLDLSDSENIKQKYRKKLELLKRGFLKIKEKN